MSKRWVQVFLSLVLTCVVLRLADGPVPVVTLGPDESGKGAIAEFTNPGFLPRYANLTTTYFGREQAQGRVLWPRAELRLTTNLAGEQFMASNVGLSGGRTRIAASWFGTNVSLDVRYGTFTMLWYLLRR